MKYTRFYKSRVSKNILRDAGKKVGQGGPTGAKGHLLP